MNRACFEGERDAHASGLPLLQVAPQLDGRIGAVSVQSPFKSASGAPPLAGGHRYNRLTLSDLCLSNQAPPSARM